MNAVALLLEAAQKSAAELAKRVSNVRYSQYQANMTHECIDFDLDGAPHSAVLKGRNAVCVLTSNQDANAHIAVRAMLDGHAKPL